MDGAALIASAFQEKNKAQPTITEADVRRAEEIIAEAHRSGVNDPKSDQTTGMTDSYFTAHHLLSREFPENVARRLFKTLVSRAKRAIADSSRQQSVAAPQKAPEEQEEQEQAGQTAEIQAWEPDVADVDDDASEDEIDFYAEQNEAAPDM